MASGETPVEIEEDDELFEIDLEAVDTIFPPPHLSDDHTYNGFLTAGGGGAALLANCLLPISDLSSAVPMDDSGRCEVFPVATPPGFSLRQALIDRLVMEIATGDFI